MAVKTVPVGLRLRRQTPLRKERLLSPLATRVYGPPSMKQVPKHPSKAGESSSPSAFLRNANTANLARRCSPKSLALTVDDHSGCVLDPLVQAGTKRRILNGGAALSYGRVTGLAMETINAFEVDDIHSALGSRRTCSYHASTARPSSLSARPAIRISWSLPANHGRLVG
jgi:hypothetical protein